MIILTILPGSQTPIANIVQCSTLSIGNFTNIYYRTHNVRVYLYIAYLACGSASLYIKTLYFFLTVLLLSAAAPVTNIKIRYDAKTPHFAIFGTRSYMCSTVANFLHIETSR